MFNERFKLVREYVSKYGIVGSLALLAPFVAPYINDYLDSRQETMINRALISNRAVMIRRVESIAWKLQKNIVGMLDTCKLSDEQALYVMRTAVGYQSIHKLEWLKSLLEDYDNKFSNENYIKEKIRLELIKQSNIYVTSLDSFSHPALGTLGTYIIENFNMKNFLTNINKLVLSRDLSIEDKLAYIMQAMLSMQEELWVKASIDMNKEL